MQSCLSIDTLSRVRIPAAVLVARFALSACAAGRIPFTQNLRDQYGLEGDDLKKLQYFIASDVTLQSRGELRAGGSLVFGSHSSDRDPERKYKLSAKRWTDYYGELVYDNKIYYAVKGSGQVYLEVVAESLNAVETRKKILPGRTLPTK